MTEGATAQRAADGPATASAGGRIGQIDALRGVALIAMVLYHLVWLTNFFGYTTFDLYGDAFWLAARAVILSGFLAISGFVMGLADGLPRSWPRYFRRLGLLAASALLITLSTLWTFPEAYIFFGVLHCLTAAAVLALAFMRLPWWGVALAALAWLSVTRLPFTPVFDQPWLLWLGLVSRLPHTNDYVPLFPWFGVVLAGLAAGKLAGPPERFRALVAGLPAPPFLRWPGRHTLPLYLIHPPLIFGALTLLAKVWPPTANVPTDTAVFMNQCMRGCQEIEQSVGRCSTYCGCVLSELAEAGLWVRVRRSELGPALQDQIVRITLECRAPVFGDVPVPAARPEVGPEPAPN